MRITRRDFLKYCTIAAGALGLTTTDLLKIEQAFAKEGTPQVVWIPGRHAQDASLLSRIQSITTRLVHRLMLKLLQARQEYLLHLLTCSTMNS